MATTCSHCKDFCWAVFVLQVWRTSEGFDAGDCVIALALREAFLVLIWRRAYSWVWLEVGRLGHEQRDHRWLQPEMRRPEAGQTVDWRDQWEKNSVLFCWIIEKMSNFDLSGALPLSSFHKLVSWKGTWGTAKQTTILPGQGTPPGEWFAIFPIPGTGWK